MDEAGELDVYKIDILEANPNGEAGLGGCHDNDNHTLYWYHPVSDIQPGFISNLTSRLFIAFSSFVRAKSGER
jgi:hypothetical protein